MKKKRISHIFIFGLILGLTNFAIGKQTTSPPIPENKKQDSTLLNLSSTSSVYWPKEFHLDIQFIASFNGFYISNINPNFTAWISRKTPDGLANIKGVERIWRENQDNSEKAGEPKGKDLGCKSLSAFTFQCHREAILKPKEFSVDSLLWSSDKDLVFLRVTSLISTSDAWKIFNQFQIKTFSAKIKSSATNTNTKTKANANAKAKAKINAIGAVK